LDKENNKTGEEKKRKKKENKRGEVKDKYYTSPPLT
jgi:hypothetical protein